MDHEELRQIVAEQVRRALRGESLPDLGPSVPPDGPIVVAILCGGRGGLSTALSQVRDIAQHAHIIGVLTPAAKEVVGEERLKSKAGTHEIIVPGSNVHPWDLAHRGRVVVIAQLTRTTLAKLALGLSDTFATSLALHALWAGVPVIVARDGVDPDLAACDQCEPPIEVPWELTRLYEGYLDILSAFGAQVVRAEQLAAATLAALAGEEPRTDRPLTSRRVITEEDVVRASRRGESLQVRGAIITPLARDKARELNVPLIEQ